MDPLGVRADDIRYSGAVNPEFPTPAIWQVVVLLVALALALGWFGLVMHEFWAVPAD